MSKIRLYHQGVTVDYSTNGIVMPNRTDAGIAGLIEKMDASELRANLAFIGRYVLTFKIFTALSGLTLGSGGEIQRVDAINLNAQKGLVETLSLKVSGFDCGSLDGFVSASVDEFSSRERC